MIAQKSRAKPGVTKFIQVIDIHPASYSEKSFTQKIAKINFPEKYEKVKLIVVGHGSPNKSTMTSKIGGELDVNQIAQAVYSIYQHLIHASTTASSEFFRVNLYQCNSALGKDSGFLESLATELSKKPNFIGEIKGTVGQVSLRPTRVGESDFNRGVFASKATDGKELDFEYGTKINIVIEGGKLRHIPTFLSTDGKKEKTKQELTDEEHSLYDSICLTIYELLKEEKSPIEDRKAAEEMITGFFSVVDKFFIPNNVQDLEIAILYLRAAVSGYADCIPAIEAKIKETYELIVRECARIRPEYVDAMILGKEQMFPDK